MKMKMSCFLRSATALLLCSGLLLSCNSKKADKKAQGGDFLYRVGFLNISDKDPTCYPSMLEFVKRIESEELLQRVGVNTIEALTADSDSNIERQTTNVETMLTSGVDMLFIIGVDTEGNSIAVELCNEAGIPVFMVGTEASRGNWKFVGFNEQEVGLKQGEWCAANLSQNAKIFYLQGAPGREATLFREAGFRQGIASRSDLAIVSAQTGMWEVARAMQVTEDWIQAYGNDIGCIVAADTQMIVGAIEALTAANMNESVVTCGMLQTGSWDLDPLRSGVEDYAVFAYWPSIGVLCADIAADFYLGREIPERNNIELFDVTPENYTQFFNP
jgi:ABC-type sugar transport system substrate-binding protein